MLPRREAGFEGAESWIGSGEGAIFWGEGSGLRISVVALACVVIV